MIPKSKSKTKISVENSIILLSLRRNSKLFPGKNAHWQFDIEMSLTNKMFFYLLEELVFYGLQKRVFNKVENVY